MAHRHLSQVRAEGVVVDGRRGGEGRPVGDPDDRGGEDGAEARPDRRLGVVVPDAPAPTDLKVAAAALAAGFPAPLPGLVAATDPRDVQRWVLRDRPALRQWSTGRITLAGDAAHPTSPYAAYGAGMSIEDGYFIGRALRGVDLGDLPAVQQALQSYEDPRKPHTSRQVQQAWLLGKVFHHTPAPLRPVRDFVSDHTPFLQKVAGDTNPKEINKQLTLIED